MGDWRSALGEGLVTILAAAAAAWVALGQWRAEMTGRRRAGWLTDDLLKGT